MGAEAEADELELVVDDPVKKNQVGFDMAVADAGEFALERMVVEGCRKRTLQRRRLPPVQFRHRRFIDDRP